MTSLVSRFKTLEKLAIDHSPVLLTAIGVAGVIGTSILSMRAARKADRLLAEAGAKVVPGEDFGLKQEVAATWTAYIPPVVSGTMTITAIVLANRIGAKRAAALAAACTISEKAYTEYREAVVKKFGEKEERQMRNEIVQKHVTDNPPSTGNVLMVSGGDHLFCEMYTRRYFRSDMETIRKAINDINYQINTEGYATISDFYDLVGLEHTDVSDEMGWSSDKLMAVDFDPIMSEKGEPCVGISFMTQPVRYQRFH